MLPQAVLTGILNLHLQVRLMLRGPQLRSGATNSNGNSTGFCYTRFIGCKSSWISIAFKKIFLTVFGSCCPDTLQAICQPGPNIFESPRRPILQNAKGIVAQKPYLRQLFL